MSETLTAAAIGAAAGLIGALVGGGVSLFVERVRTRAAARGVRQAELMAACSEFTAAITSSKYLSMRLAQDPSVDPAIEEAMDRARVSCERLRLLVESKETQQAARLALRHAYAVRVLARDGLDPRAAEYPNEPPRVRLRAALTTLYIGVRHELGSDHPESVFEDLDN